jgi:DNA-binding response OmpR family regulator
MPLTRLLYAEDDPDTRDLIVLALEMEGFEVVCPSTTKDFLRLAQEEMWHLFMLDTWMPEIDGFTLCNKIRAFDPFTPVVFYSGAALEWDKQRAFDCGAADYVVKPIELEILIERLRSVVASAQPAGSR